MITVESRTRGLRSSRNKWPTYFIPKHRRKYIGQW